MHTRTRRRPLIRQRRIPGTPRDSMFSALDPPIQEWVRQQAAHFGCYPSFVINNALSIVSNIDIFDDTLQQRTTKRKSK